MSKGNMYEGVDTWNPLSGRCSHNCSYCSSNTFMRYPAFKKKYSGCLRLDNTAMRKNLGKGKTWFVVAQNDLFAEAVPQIFIDAIIDYCKNYPHNHYIFQTKNPKRMLLNINKFEHLNCSFGTTIESNRHYPDIYRDSPPIHERIAAISLLKHSFITIEPCIAFNLKELVELIRVSEVPTVNIGADSKNNHLPEPSKEEVLQLIAELSKFTTVKEKSNLKRLRNVKVIG